MMDAETLEKFAIRAAKGNNGGEWATHYTEEQKEHWRQFVRDLTQMPPPKGTFYCHPDDLPHWSGLEQENVRLKEALALQTQQQAYPCSPHCAGYLREQRLQAAITAFAKATGEPNGPSLTIQRHTPSWEAWKTLCDVAAAHGQ
jgi:hypothetical protein